MLQNHEHWGIYPIVSRVCIVGWHCHFKIYNDKPTGDPAKYLGRKLNERLR